MVTIVGEYLLDVFKYFVGEELPRRTRQPQRAVLAVHVEHHRGILATWNQGVDESTKKGEDKEK